MTLLTACASASTAKYSLRHGIFQRIAALEVAARHNRAYHKTLFHFYRYFYG